MIRRFISIITIAIVLSSQLVRVANAASSYDQVFYSTNDILFYDPRCATGTGEGLMTLTGKDNLENILQFFMKKGLTLAQASGIAGNFMAESGLDPTIIQGGGHAQPGSNFQPTSGVGFGLAQWTSGGRQQGLVKMAQTTGSDITSLNVQLAYAWQELSESYPDTLTQLKATDDPVQAAVVVHDGYESSADSHEQVVANRGGNAKKFYDMYVDQPALAGSTDPSDTSGDGGNTATATDASATTSTSGTSSELGSTINESGCAASDFAGGNFKQTVLAYAWPQYSSRTDQMPAYADAVKKAAATGIYYGGNNGDDCGGFVTLLMINSGYEPGYNDNGHGGATTSQEAWLKQHWQQIPASDVADASKRQPGDVAINSEHTYVYVGQIPGFGSKIASASLGGPVRAPMAGEESPTDNSFDWYRKSTQLTEAPL